MDNKIPWKTCKCKRIFYVGPNEAMAPFNPDRIMCPSCETIDRLERELARALNEIKRLKAPITIVAAPMGDGPHNFTRDLL